MSASVSGTRTRSAGPIDEVIAAALARWSVPGVAVAVFADGGRFSRAGGVADLERGTPVTPDTLFRVCSITKPIVATLVMGLVDEGRLDLDAPIAAALPGLALADPAAREAATMRHLLTHTVGFDCEIAADLHAFGDDAGALNRLVAAFGSLRQWTPPGQSWAYCNSGFWLAGAVAAAAAGADFETALRERVLDPLGMSRTVTSAAAAAGLPIAFGHEQVAPDADEHRIVRSLDFPRARVPSGGVLSTAPDLIRFAEFHLGLGGGASPVADAARRAMQEPQVRLRQTGAAAWGIGWELDEVGGARIVGHDGSYHGFQSRLVFVPEQRFAFAALANSSRGGAAIGDIERWALAHWCGLEADAPRFVDLPPADLGRLAGTYRQPSAETGAEVEFVAVDDGLVGAYSEFDREGRPATTYPPVLFRPLAEREFVVADGEHAGWHADFLFPGDDPPRFVRLGGQLADRVAADPAAGGDR